MSRLVFHRAGLMLVAGVVAVAAVGATAATGETKAAPTKLFAVVNAGGAIYKQSGVRRVTHPGTGEYHVTFNRGVDACAAVASTGGHRTGAHTSTGTPVGVASVATFGNSVDVLTELVTATGLTNYDRGFHLILMC